jgi:uncharacterized protein YndB with AHSA1/START domain
MNNHGELITNDTIEFRRLLPGTIESVWPYLVDSEKRAKWLAGGSTDLKEGGTIELTFRNSELSDLEDVAPAKKYKDMPDCISFTGVITCFKPPHRLSYTWSGENKDSEVCFELEKVDDKTLLILTHSRLSSREESLSISGGWHTHINILEDVLHGREPQPFWLQHNALEKEYENFDINTK